MLRHRSSNQKPVLEVQTDCWDICLAYGEHDVLTETQDVVEQDARNPNLAILLTNAETQDIERRILGAATDHVPSEKTIDLQDVPYTRLDLMENSTFIEVVLGEQLVVD